MFLLTADTPIVIDHNALYGLIGSIAALFITNLTSIIKQHLDKNAALAAAKLASDLAREERQEVAASLKTELTERANELKKVTGEHADALISAVKVVGEDARAAYTEANGVNQKLEKMKRGDAAQVDAIQATGEDTNERVKKL